MINVCAAPPTPILCLAYHILEGKERLKAANLGKSVVLSLVKKYENSGRNITMDNFLSSKDLCEELLQKGLTMVGLAKAKSGKSSL